MSDHNSSLPIRTENAGDVIAKIADATIPSQQLAVEADGSINVNATATDLDIRDLSASQDNVAISDGTDTLAVNNDGSINVVATATDLDIRDLAFATDKVDVSGSEVSLDATTLAALENITVTATDLDIRDLAFATDKVDVSGSEVSLDSATLAALENITVSATDLDIRDLSHTQDSVKIGDGTDLLAVNADGSINVKVLDGTPGSDVCDYNTAAAVAGGGTSTHTYTSVGNFYLTQIEASGSGKMKIEVQVNSVTKFVQFNSTSTPNMSIEIKQPILATTGQTVTVIRTNRENQAQDVYSTICGYTL